MKTLIKIFITGLSVFILLSVLNCKKEPPKTAPVVTTSSLSNITPTGVSCGGNVTDDGGAAVTSRGVCWSLNQNPSTSDNHSSDGSGTGSFTTTISGLMPGTTYYFRAYATNSVGTSYGSQVSTSTSATAPSVTTVTVNSITTSSASSGGAIPSNGGGEITQKGVCWGTAQNPTVDANKTENGAGSQAYASNITGLTPNTKYYVRAYATNGAGTSYGSELSFTTKAVETLAQNEQMFPGTTGTTATAVLDGVTVNCTEINGFKIYQGDIVLSAPEEQQTKGVAITSTINYWPANRVFYKTDNKVNKTRIEAAIAEIESKTNLKFIKSVSDANYVYFIWDKDGCSSYVGRIGGRQRLWLADWATTGTVIHEILHSVGIKHEQARPDRDDYIIVVDTNIIKGYENNFEKMSKGEVEPSDKFDFNSIMLYSSMAFSKNDKPTLVKKSDKTTWELNRENLSEDDVKIINKIYPKTTAAPYINFDEVGIVPGGAYILEADIVDDGGSPVTMRGFCWTTDGTVPSLNNQYRTSGTGIGKFQMRFENLISGTQYKFKAFAINGVGTAYSNYSMDYTHPSLATVTTGSISNITPTTATCQNSIVTTDGIIPLTMKGVCWSTTQNPTITDSQTSNGSAIATYNSSLTALQPGTTYYVRAYATNYIGTAYGNQVSFTTTIPPLAAFTGTPTSIQPGGTVQFTDQSANNPTGWSWDFGDGGTSTLQNPSHIYSTAGNYTVALTATNEHGSSTETKNNYISVINGVPDIDGNIYGFVTIGTQIWMTHNLKTTKYNDGTPIPNITDDDTWENATTPGYCDNGNSAANAVTYGRLYNYYAVSTGKLCPTGWHVPSESEWNTLVSYLGGASVAGGKLKQTGTTLWNAPNTGATNESGFTAIPGGLRAYDGSFAGPGGHASFWTSTAFPNADDWSLGKEWPHAVWRRVFNHNAQIEASHGRMIAGFSVRCVKN